MKCSFTEESALTEMVFDCTGFPVMFSVALNVRLRGLELRIVNGR